jgi:hypothetical protein
MKVKRRESGLATLTEFSKNFPFDQKRASYQESKMIGNFNKNT